MGYGGPLRASSIKITAQGITGTLMVPLPPELLLPGNNQSLVFVGAVFAADGSCVVSRQSPVTFSVGGFEAQARDIHFDGKEVVVNRLSVSAPAGMSPRNIPLGDLRFDARGITSPAKVSDPEGKHDVTYQRDGWTLYVDALSLDDQGLSGSAELVLPITMGQRLMRFNQLRWLKHGEFICGEADEQFRSAIVHGVRTELQGARLAKVDKSWLLVVPEPAVPMEFLDTPDLLFGPTGFDPRGMVVQSTFAPFDQEFVAYNRVRVVTEGGIIGSSAISLRGSLGSVDWKDGALVPIPQEGLEMVLTGMLSVEASAPEVQATYPYAWWPVRGRGFVFHNLGIDVKENQVDFQGAVLDLGSLSFDGDGNLKEPSRQRQDRPTDLFQGRSRILDTFFNHEGMVASLQVDLPQELGGHDFTFDTVYLYPDQKFFIEQRIGQLSYPIGSFNFDFKDIWFSPDGLSMGSTTIHFPENLESTRVTVYGLRIDPDGVMVKEESFISSFPLLGAGIDLTSILLRNGELTIKGALDLPESLPGYLSGRAIQLKELRISLEGRILALEADFAGDHAIPYGEDGNLSFQGATAQYKDGELFLLFHEARVVSYSVNGGPHPVPGLRYNMTRSAWDYSALEGSEVLSLIPRL